MPRTSTQEFSGRKVQIAVVRIAFVQIITQTLNAAKETVLHASVRDRKKSLGWFWCKLANIQGSNI